AMAASGSADEERGLLDRLLELAASIERISAATSYRFRAARAYHALVERRTEELREGRLPGLQTVGEFMERRLLPAMRTCRATEDRLESLSQRLARASDLLRTRVDIAVQAQNRDVLRSVDQRARLQLLLQETVEGLSAFAITYYVLGILAYALDGLHGWYDGFDPHATVGLAAPVAFAIVWVMLRRIRKRLMRDQDAGPT
ncbi:MAG TPA: DUF3422 domain-containing protein, partial [Geminicoccaceae bacterium]|nr:DUF3422 domain-containing protein [Geminicoccaceae bacterium]